ncbi:MAG: MlaD family protein [Planctomycetota bacterium]
MDENKLRFGVGVLVIAAIGIGVILMFLFGAVPRVLTGEYKILVAFPSAKGVSSNTPVLLRGVKIGRVIDQQLREDDVLITLGIESKYRESLTHEYLPRIGVDSVITNDAKLEFVRATDAEIASKDLLESRNRPYFDKEFLSYGETDEDPFSLLFNIENELKLTLQSVREASDSIGTVGGNVNQLVDDARGVVQQTDDGLEKIAEDARNAIIEFQGAMKDVRDVIGDPELKQSLQKALAELPDVLNEAQNTFQSTQKTFESFEKVGQRFEKVGEVAEKAVGNVDKTVDTVRETIETAKGTFQSAEQTIKNIEAITEPIAENSDALVASVLTDLQSLDRTLREVEAFAAAVNQNEGTIQRLIKDDELYFRVRRTVENIEAATAKIRPILDDVRIFSDKIARDPRELGVRGALNRRPSGAGLK